MLIYLNLVYLLINIYSPMTRPRQSPLIEGYVIDKNTNKPVRDAVVSLGSVTVNSDHTGKFKIWLPVLASKDTLKVNAYSYLSLEMVLIPSQPDLNNLKIFLIPQSIMLDDVKIFASPSYKADSIQTREQFNKIFNYDAPKVIEAFNLTSINVSVLYEALSKEKKLKNNLQKQLVENEQYKYSTQKISKELIKSITKLDGKELDDFYYQYMPTFNFLYEATDYEIIRYIKEKYKQDLENKGNN